MALTLDEIKHYIPSLQDKPVDEIVRVLNENGIDTSGINVEPKEEAGLLKSYVGIPLAKGVSGIRGAIGYGLEASGIAPETGREMQAAQEAYAQELTAEQSQQAREDKGKTLIDENGNYGGYNAGTFVQDLFESAPSTAAMALPGGLLAKGASVGLKAAGASKAVANLVGSSLGFSASEGALSGAQNAAQIQQEIRNADISVLSKHPEFIKTVNEFTDQSLPIEERENIAREILARRAGDKVFAETFVKTGGIALLTGGGFLGGMFRGGHTGNLAARVFKSGGSEFIQESPQSGYEQKTLNQARKDYLNPKQDVNQGVVTSALEGGIVGFAMGGVGGIAKAKSVDEAIVASDQALSEKPAWQSPEYKVVPDAEKIVQNRTIPGQGVQEFIDSQYQDTGYVPKTIWESPNVKEIQDQIERNKTFGQIENQVKLEKEQAFFQAEQDAIQQKQNELAEMELNPDASKQDIKKFRKARIDLQLQKRKNAELFRQGLGFEIIPLQSGNVENDQLRLQLKQAIGQQREKLPEDKKLSEDTGTYEPQNQLDSNDQSRTSAEVLPGELPPLADNLAYEKETAQRQDQTATGREELPSNADTGTGGGFDDGGIDSVPSRLPIGKQLSDRTDLPSASSELLELKQDQSIDINEKRDIKQQDTEPQIRLDTIRRIALSNIKDGLTKDDFLKANVDKAWRYNEKSPYYHNINLLKQDLIDVGYGDKAQLPKIFDEVLEEYTKSQNDIKKEPTADTKTQQETQEPDKSESRVVAPSAEKAVDTGTVDENGEVSGGVLFNHVDNAKKDQALSDIEKLKNYKFIHDIGSRVTDNETGKKYIVSDRYIENGEARYTVYPPGKKQSKGYYVWVKESDLQGNETPTAKESISEPKEKRTNRLDDSAFKETMIDIDEGGQLSADKVLGHVREKIKSYQAFIDCVRTS